MKLYVIRNWNDLYENNRTRELKKLDWLPIPNKQDGDGYTLLMEHRDGAAIFGAWIACAQIASRCDPRGTLLRDGKKPHDSTSLSRMTRIPVKVIDAMLAAVSHPDINWLEIKEIDINCGNPASKCDNPADGCLEGKGRERTEGKEETASRSDPLEVPEKLKTQEFMAEWARWQTYRREMKGIKNWVELFRAQLDHLATFDVKTATEMLKQSLRNGWKGLFDVKGAGANQAPPAGQPDVAESILRQRELERVEERIRVIRGGYADHQTMDEQDKSEFKKLKARKNELVQMLGMTI